MSSAATRHTAWGRALVIMPTYNERDNLKRVVEHLLDTVPGVDVLVVDDGSPDGTGHLADELAAAKPRIHVLHRALKNGLGRAYLAGFAWASDAGYDVVVEMDADGSHPADALPAMLDALVANPGTGLVIGSRWVPGGSVVNWPRRRLWLSRSANAYARVALGFPVSDITAGFRAYPIDVVTEISRNVDSHGYSFQIEMAMRVHDAGYAIREVPIEFREREAGSSKMSQAVVIEAMTRVTGWGIARRLENWRTAAIGGALTWLFARLLLLGVAIGGRALHHLPLLPKGGFFALFYGWDSNYFSSIARNGYFGPHSASGAAAFFPGYPLLSRGIANLIDPSGPGIDSVVYAMWLVSAIASLLVGILVWRLAQDRYGRRVAAAATVLVIAGPYSLFLVASYSEAMFLVFAIAAWILATRRRWLAAGVLVTLASTVRPNGLFLAAAIVVMYIVAQRAAGQAIRIRTLLATGVGFLGTAAYFAYLLAATGSLLTWERAEAQWGRTLEWPWVTFYNTAGRILYASSLDRRIQFGLDTVFAAILVVAIVYFIRTRAWAEATYVGLTAVSLMTSFTYMSLARSSAVLFPIAIAVAATIERPKRRWIFVVAAGLGILLLLFNTAQFTSGYWAD